MSLSQLILSGVILVLSIICIILLIKNSNRKKYLSLKIDRKNSVIERQAKLLAEINDEIFSNNRKGMYVKKYSTLVHFLIHHTQNLL